MTEPDPLVLDLHRRAGAARIRVGKMMRRAGSDPSTWSRWMNGARPNLSTLRAVETALETLIAERPR